MTVGRVQEAVSRKRDGRKGNGSIVGAFALCVTLHALCSSGWAQQPPQIGYLLGSLSSAGDQARSEAFRQGLRELGYIEGKNLVIEYRSAEGKADRFPSLAAELVRLTVELIVTAGPLATRAAKQATSTIPIVMANDPDPVGNGFVASLARPGGNVTGLSNLAPELGGKQLELLKEIVPKLSRVAVFGTSTQPGTAQRLREMEVAAGAFGLKLQYSDVQSPKDIEGAFRAANKSGADAVLIMMAGVVAGAHRTRILELAAKSRLPTIVQSRGFVEAGGLISYGVYIRDLDRRAATYVDKILKGARPADLPIEQPTKFELVINLKTAKQIGLTIPPNVLARADRVIR
jgi:putative ABC transport system substrate-binding protein